MEMLKNVYYKLEENHQAGLLELLEELEAEGICRIVAGEILAEPGGSSGEP